MMGILEKKDRKEQKSVKIGKATMAAPCGAVDRNFHDRNGNFGFRRKVLLGDAGCQGCGVRYEVDLSDKGPKINFGENGVMVRGRCHFWEVTTRKPTAKDITVEIEVF